MSAFVSNTELLWDNDVQNRQVFNWTEILRQWNESLTLHPYVQTVIDNLKVTSDPNSSYDFPLSHFQKFLNWEREGLTWFLYEVVTMRYMWGGETRLDYVRDLIEMDEIHLDEGFPTFPGSPKNYRTVRKFLQDSLSSEELEYVEMMPELVTPTPTTPSRPIRTEVPSAPARLSLRVERDVTTTSYPPIEIRVIRKNDKHANDDMIVISKNTRLFEETYALTYKDCADKKSRKTFVAKDMTRSQVFDYLSTTLRILAVDEEPFSSIQLMVPNAPSVMLPIDMDSYSRTLVYDAVESVMDAWPVRVV